MQILETFLSGKENNPFTCEDGIFISEHMAVVIDGVTAKGSRLWNGQKSGYYAKEVLLDYLKQKNIEQQNAETLIRNLDEVLGGCIAAGWENLPQEEYPRASVIIYNDIYKEVWSYGDCQCRINETIHTHKKEIDDLNAAQRAYYLEYYLQKGMTLEELSRDDLGRKAIQKNLRMQFTFENKIGTFGYPILNGKGVEPSMICIYKVQEGDEVILASDGYPKLLNGLKESEKALEKILREDPMCFRQFRSTKGMKEGNISYDDRAFCRILISNQ